MGANQEEQDKAVLAWLTGGQRAETGGDDNSPAARQFLDDHVDAGLRSLGYNYHERNRLRRGQPRPRNMEKYRDTTAKRFRHYIVEKLPDLPDGEIPELVAAWVRLTNSDLDLAQRWWASGIDPAKPGQLASAIKAGFDIKDLGQVVHGRTIAEHLQAGYPIDWCMGALHWQRPA